MTNKTKICLASDNFTTVHPAVMEAILEANKGYAPSYGSDAWTKQAEELIQHVFIAKPKVLIVPTGTGANVLALKLACRRYESVICTDIAHLNYQECGAAESIVGCKLLSVPHQEGKITLEGIIRKLKNERTFGKHSTSPRVLSITQPTEVGTVYTLQELKVLSKLCKEEDLLFHMDGSRLYNAAVSLKVSLDEIVQAASLDLLSLGGTKNGLLCAESLLIFNPNLQEGSDHLHKQNLGLVSKMRYLSAQYIPFFKKDLWHTLATQANQKAQEIASLISMTSHFSLSYPVETNQIFFTAPASWIPIIQEKIFCYPWDKEKNEIRFITSWNTTQKDVEGVRALLDELSDYRN
jgi:threonine aldolase